MYVSVPLSNHRPRGRNLRLRLSGQTPVQRRWIHDAAQSIVEHFNEVDARSSAVRAVVVAGGASGVTA